jgi:excisionase family DNA binding protein
VVSNGARGVQLIRRFCKPNTWWSLADAVHYTGLSVTTLRRAARRGQLVGTFVGGRIWRFRQEDCDQFMIDQARTFNPKVHR